MSFLGFLGRWLKKNVVQPDKKKKKIQKIKKKTSGEKLFKKTLKKNPPKTKRYLKKIKSRPSLVKKPFEIEVAFGRRKWPIFLQNWRRPQDYSLKTCVRSLIFQINRQFCTLYFSMSEQSDKQVLKMMYETCFSDLEKGDYSDDYLNYQEDVAYKVYHYFDDHGEIGEVSIEEKKELLQFCRKQVRLAYTDLLMTLDFKINTKIKK